MIFCHNRRKVTKTDGSYFKIEYYLVLNCITHISKDCYIDIQILELKEISSILWNSSLTQRIGGSFSEEQYVIAAFLPSANIQGAPIMDFSENSLGVVIATEGGQRPIFYQDNGCQFVLGIHLSCQHSYFMLWVLQIMIFDQPLNIRQGKGGYKNVKFFP